MVADLEQNVSVIIDHGGGAPMTRKLELAATHMQLAADLIKEHLQGKRR
jgi:hypothetical protein